MTEFFTEADCDGAQMRVHLNTGLAPEMIPSLSLKKANALLRERGRVVYLTDILRP